MRSTAARAGRPSSPYARRALMSVRDEWQRGSLRDLARVEHNFAVIELDAAEIGAAHDLEVMRGHEDGRSGGVDFAEQLENAARGALVEIARGLVGDDDERI